MSGAGGTVEGDVEVDRVSLTAVSKVYGRHRALAKVDLQLAAGRVCGLLGPNGAGKTTLISILSTLLRPTSGAVRYYAGDAVVPPRALRQSIGLVGHASHLYGDLSGAENLLLFGHLYGLPDPDGRSRELLTRLGLTTAAVRPVRTYSRGMTQRLALARALLHAPRLLLLDEPFSGLDQAGVTIAQELIREHHAAGAIIVLVAHDVAIVSELCDHVVMLRRGGVAHDEHRAAGFSPGELKDLLHGTTRG